MTRDDLAEMVFDKYHDRFMKAAEDEHKARVEKAKLAKLNQVKPVASVDKSAEDVLADLI